MVNDELEKAFLKWEKRLIKEKDYPPFRKLIDEFILDLKRIKMWENRE